MIQDNIDNNRRIAKNTLLLYVRMAFTMIVSLFTSRIILKALGVVDFGIYNVVGGIVAMFSVISASLSASISRFITYELGKGNLNKLKRVFSSAVTIQIIIGLLVLFLAETIGLWFFNDKINIPYDRTFASNCVFQFSILTFIIDLISVPYNASIIAHEKMSAFAYISIFDVIAKLVIVYLLYFSPFDKLIFYAFLMAIESVILRIIYGVYCKRKFEECVFHYSFDKNMLKDMFGFAGWNFIGASSAILRDQGGNIIINLFCGPAVNAARGIAFQVSGAVNGFASNFMTALNPQITKSYASKDYEYMINLIFRGARFSCYLLLLVSIPVLINTQYILGLWLGQDNVPNHTQLFVQLVLLFAISESLSGPLITAMLATGNIRNYQIVVGGLQLMNLPISYFFLRNDFIPETVLIVCVVISQCCLLARVYMLRQMIGFPIGKYYSKVYINVLVVALLSAILPSTLSFVMASNFVSFILTTLLSITCSILVVIFVGCNKEERIFIMNKIINLKKKFS
jgi:O-antigen/teichoic acid export membrane protein